MFFFSTGHGFGDQKTDRLLLSFTAINSIGALSIVSARRRMCLLNKYLPDPGSNGIRGKYLISAVYFLCGLASDVLLKTPARAGVVLKSPREPRKVVFGKSFQNFRRRLEDLQPLSWKPHRGTQTSHQSKHTHRTPPFVSQCPAPKTRTR